MTRAGGSAAMRSNAASMVGITSQVTLTEEKTFSSWEAERLGTAMSMTRDIKRPS
jgi:hypothetical protein